MPNPYFKFKQFTIYHDRCAMKVTTDSCLFGAWVAKELANENRSSDRVLDIGSGTGLLSLMVAQKNEVAIDAVEIDKEAAAQSLDNIAASPWKKKIHIFNEDITKFRTNSKYGCIISNPPFYENDLSSENKRKNRAHHSEDLTLVEVLEIIVTNIENAGIFFLMLPYKRKQELERLLEQNGLYLTKVVVLSQSLTHGPFRILVKGSDRNSRIPGEISMSIWDEEHRYTHAFVELLKDYYLYL